jgi:hypothetical protein
MFEWWMCVTVAEGDALALDMYRLVPNQGHCFKTLLTNKM